MWFKINSLSFFIVSLLFNNQLFAQEKLKARMAEKYFNKYSFADAAPLYEDLASKNAFNSKYVLRAAECYRLLGNTEKAEVWYAKLINLDVTELYFILKYAEVLESNKKYAEAQKYYNLYKTKNGKDSRAERKTKASHLVRIDTLCTYKIDNLSFNTQASEFGFVPFKSNDFVFSSNRKNDKEKYVKNYYNWNNQPFLDLYFVKQTKPGNFEEPYLYSGQVNSKYHEGPICIDNSERTVYLTRNNFNGKKSQKSKEGVNKLKLFVATFDSSAIGKLNEFPYNNNEYSIGHASISKDGKCLYFSSDMPGGFGGADLYVCEKKDGKWTEPKNLGNVVNTEGNEMFTFVSADNKLYFSSDGHLGFGGLDVYAAELNKDEIKNIQNLGNQINSNKDDFSFYVNEDNKTGYFSSNREGGKGDDDVYSFELLKVAVVVKKINGTAKDKNGNALEGVTVKLLDNEGKLIQSLTTGKDGNYDFLAEPNKNYFLKGNKEKYSKDQKQINSNGESKNYTIDLILEKEMGLSLYGLVSDKKTKQALEGVTIKLKNNKTGNEEVYTTPETGDFTKVLLENNINDSINYSMTLEKRGYLSKQVNFKKHLNKDGQYNLNEVLDVNLDKIEVGSDISVLIEIKPIYFDLGKYLVRKDAAAELDKIVKVMNDNPTLVLELGSHTDCRGTAASNEKLSGERAKTSAAYIKKRITKPERISGKGYGESKLKNGCACEGAVKSSCSEEEQQQNRRTEFIIIEL